MRSRRSQHRRRIHSKGPVSNINVDHQADAAIGVQVIGAVLRIILYNKTLRVQGPLVDMACSVGNNSYRVPLATIDCCSDKPGIKGLCRKHEAECVVQELRRSCV